MCDFIPLKEGESIFDLKFSLEDIIEGRKAMIKSRQIQFIETPYGTIEIIEHLLFKKESKDWLTSTQQ